MAPPRSGEPDTGIDETADWQRRVVGRSLRGATERSIDRGGTLIRCAAALLERSNGDGFTVQDVADEAGQSLRTLYQYFESKDDLLLAVFEEAMRTYARAVRKAIVDLDDPLERLGGAIVASLRMPEFSGTGVDRGLARLRLKLGEVEPELVARAQEPVTMLMRDLVEGAVASGKIHPVDPEEATYIVMALKSAFITGQTLANDFGVRMPSLFTLAAFCLEGLGARHDDAWFLSINERLRMPKRKLAFGTATNGKGPARRNGPRSAASA